MIFISWLFKRILLSSESESLLLLFLFILFYYLYLYFILFCILLSFRLLWFPRLASSISLAIRLLSVNYCLASDLLIVIRYTVPLLLLLLMIMITHHYYYFNLYGAKILNYFKNFWLSLWLCNQMFEFTLYWYLYIISMWINNCIWMI